MIKLLPFILIPVLLVAGLGYWRYLASKNGLSTPQTQTSGQKDQAPIEVPKTLPEETLDDRVKSLEDTLTKLVKQFNDLKSSPNSSLDNKISQIQSDITDLKTRLTALEKATPAPAGSSNATVYIPLGAGGQTSSNTEWTNLGTFQATVDPASYPGYKSMQFEVNMRLNQPGGTLYARLYSSGSLDSSQVSSTSTSSTLYDSSTFTLSGGSKTYVLQAKTSDGSQGFIDNARIKVNF